MPNKPTPQEQLAAENAVLRAQLYEAEETLRAIHSGEVDALFVAGEGDGHLFTLKGADQSYRILIEEMSEGALTMSAEGVILYANRRLAEMLKMPLEKVIGATLHTWVAPDSQQILQSLLGKGADEKRREQLDLTASDGTQVPVYLSVSNLLIDEMPDSYCLVATDLTEQKRREEVIIASEKLTRELLAASNQSRRELLSMVEDQKLAEERLKEEIEVTTHLLMIAGATAKTTDVDRLMEQVTHCTSKILSCDICLSYLWDEEVKIFQPCQEFGLSHDMVPLFRTESIDEKMEFVRKAVEGKEPLVISEKKEDEKMRSLEDKRKDSTSQPLNFSTSVFPWILDINTLVAIPLIGKTGPLGLIVGIYKVGTGLKPAPTEFNDRDMEVMKGISNQVSVALEQARFYKESVDKTLELSHKIETIKVMNEIDRSILSTLKADELLETVTRLISKVITCERATVLLVDLERGGFIYKAGFGTAVAAKGAFIPFADTSARVVFETGRTEYVSNLPEIRPLLPHEKKLLDEGFLSHIRVPITIKGDVAGILTVGAKRVAAFTKGNLSTLEYLCSQIGVALENARLISDLEELFISVVKSLSSAIDAKSTWTAGHSERVTKYALDIAKQMGLHEKELKNLELTGLLHDVGKIGTYEYILDKPDKLTPEEIVIMRLHPVKGAEILQPIKQLKDIMPAVRHHHEYYDGTGYPDGLKGEAIPLHSRILTVADTVDAMGADRPYRKGRAMDVIIEELKRCSGTQFDPKVAEAFLKTVSHNRVGAGFKPAPTTIP